jgi:hypothetical protein
MDQRPCLTDLNRQHFDLDALGFDHLRDRDYTDESAGGDRESWHVVQKAPKSLGWHSFHLEIHGSLLSQRDVTRR